jgi:hypothetical protein
MDVYRGVVEWKKQTDIIEFDVTLYKNMNEDEFEEKEWVLMIEDVIFRFIFRNFSFSFNINYNHI